MMESGPHRATDETTTLIDTSKKKKGLNVAKTFFLVSGEILGTGVLTLPHCIAISGVSGIFILLFSLSVAVYTGVKLSKCWQMAVVLKPACEGHIRDPYPVLAEVCFGNTFRKIVSVLINILNFSGALVLFIAGNEMLQQMTGLNICYLMLISGVIIIPLTWLGTPKDIWPLSFFSLLSAVICSIIIVVMISIEEVDTLATKPQTTVRTLAFVFGASFFITSGASTYPTIQNDMVDRGKFALVVILANLVSVACYVPISLCSLFFITTDVSPNVVLAIRDKVPQYIALVVLMIHCFLAVIIMINPVFQDLERLIKAPEEFSWKRVASRISIIGLAVFIGETVPKFENLLTLVGGSLVALFAIIFPALFFMRLSSLVQKSDDVNKSKWKVQSYEKCILVFIIVFGVAASIIVTASSTLNIISEESFTLPCYLQSI